jgi:hypothetical protein
MFWHRIWLLLRAPAFGYRLATITQEAKAAEHTHLARALAVVASHRALLSQLQAIEQELAEALRDLATPRARQQAVLLTNHRMEALAEEFLAEWRARLLTEERPAA